MVQTARLEQEVASLKDTIRKQQVGQRSYDQSAYNSANTANGYE